MNVLATTWPPSCRAASPWSTPTPRTSPSLMKETGWSEDDQGEDKQSSGVPHRQTLQSTPLCQKVLPSLVGKKKKKKGNIIVAHFSSVKLFFISSYLCLVVVCVRRGISTSSLCVSLISTREAVPFDLFCTATRHCFRWIFRKETPHVYYCFT